MTFEEFCRQTLPQLGYAWPRFYRRNIKRRLIALMRRRGFPSWDALAHAPSLRRLLAPQLTVTISRFWRNEAAFRHLQRWVLPEILRGLPPGEPLVAWCAGCASGQEAFSLAMAVESLPPRLTAHHHVRIVASDIDDRALRRGLQDEWTRSELRGLDRDLRRRFLSERGGRVVFDDGIRRSVTFVRASLWDHPPVLRAHLILCRNTIMTYFHGKPREEAMARVVDALLPGGWLVLGRKESLPGRWARTWGLVPHGRRIYRRGGEPEAGAPCARAPAGEATNGR